jgi:hypothetical protein
MAAMQCISKTIKWAATTFLVLATAMASAQQVVDPDFHPALTHPEYKPERGPVVLIDEAHNNYHTASGQYEPFARVLRQDGFRVRPNAAQFSARSLNQVDVLVIVNAVSASTAKNWSAPPTPAFSDAEIAAVHKWVRQGGALLLIADHMPVPGSNQKLAAAFGVTQWSNGYAQDPSSGGLITFRRANGALLEHPVTRGRSEAERIDHVVTFAGSAFQAPAAQPLLTFTGNAVSWLPEIAGKLEAGTPKVSVKGWQQGAVLGVGKGRVALFGEAAMFSAQRVGPNREPNGMNASIATQNQQFLLNVMHWLAGTLH